MEVAVTPKRLSRIFFLRAINTLIVFVGLLIFFAFFSRYHVFISARNLRLLSKLAPDLGIVALGVGMLMICGEFDLSVSSVLPLCSYVFVSLLRLKVNLILIPFITLGVGALLGLLNGLITVKGRIPSFITTLGTMMLWRGMTLLLSHGYQRPFATSASPIFCNTFTGKILGILPVQIVWFAVVGLVLGLLLHFHRFGNWIYSTGDNKEAARAMGINTDMVKTVCFIIVGVLCAFVAMMQALRLGSFAATQGIGFELKAIAASVVGGTSLTGGIGSMVGIVLGALTIQILENGLILTGVPVFGITAFIGAAIILFVILNSYVERKRLR